MYGYAADSMKWPPPRRRIPGEFGRESMPIVISGVARALKTTLLRRRGGSDVRRWTNATNLDASWNERTELLAQWIAPGSRVMEFGAGSRFLSAVLPPRCAYIASDLIDRGGATFVCDLNAPVLPQFPAHDVAVFGGVLEYVHDVARLVRHLAPSTAAVLASYAVVTSSQRSAYERRRHGWVNDFDELSLRHLFALHGYHCSAARDWREQRLFLFEQPHRSRAEDVRDRGSHRGARSTG